MLSGSLQKGPLCRGTFQPPSLYYKQARRRNSAKVPSKQGCKHPARRVEAQFSLTAPLGLPVGTICAVIIGAAIFSAALKAAAQPLPEKPRELDENTNLGYDIMTQAACIPILGTMAFLTYPSSNPPIRHLFFSILYVLPLFFCWDLRVMTAFAVLQLVQIQVERVATVRPEIFGRLARSLLHPALQYFLGIGIQRVQADGTRKHYGLSSWWLIVIDQHLRETDQDKLSSPSKLVLESQHLRAGQNSDIVEVSDESADPCLATFDKLLQEKEEQKAS